MFGLQWWKLAGIALVLYALVGGLLLPVPQLPILEQSIRNLNYHVPMWFGMLVLLIASAIYGAKGLMEKNLVHDIKSESYAKVGMLFGAMGLVTGMIWAKNTWGDFWTNDPKLNSAAIGMLMYAAYFVLRSSIEDEEKKARISAVYNLFCLPVFIVLIFVLPRLTASLHPGNGGNPGFNSYDLDSRLRMVFYPAVLGWIFLGFWIADIQIRLNKLIYRNERED
ncbi:MAG: cytochrome c biogenesis protein CcsA [Bacteroidia bacterium]|nr:cytochrome c biogenesis protein CcsA [Bacteroidia bacterium]